MWLGQKMILVNWRTTNYFVVQPNRFLTISTESVTKHQLTKYFCLLETTKHFSQCDCLNVKRMITIQNF